MSFIKIEAILRPFNIQPLIEELKDKEKVFYLEECKGFGKRISPLSLYKNSSQSTLESLPRTKISIFVKEEHVEQLIELIISAGQTGIVGDGKIFITPVESILDIESREFYE